MVYYNRILCNPCGDLIFEALRDGMPTASEICVVVSMSASFRMAADRGGAVLGMVSLEVEAKSFNDSQFRELHLCKTLCVRRIF
jgi:hypothetical protein